MSVIYTLRCPLDQAIRYIGKTDNPSAAMRIGHARRKERLQQMAIAQ